MKRGPSYSDDSDDEPLIPRMAASRGRVGKNPPAPKEQDKKTGREGEEKEKAKEKEKEKENEKQEGAASPTTTKIYVLQNGYFDVRHVSAAEAERLTRPRDGRKQSAWRQSEVCSIFDQSD